ncbi:MAG: Na(+)/H(+) antiporter subunit D [Myxococcota bacterium]|jgi:multicomponent Na+:H+ antiporter subunit D|nr:Na(+)/H(+) antiporter subunit D [Myxococcota bacterium]
MIEAIPPGMILILGALILPFLGGALQRVWLVLLPVLGFVQLTLLPEGLAQSFEFFGYGLNPVRVDSLSLVFAYVFYLAAFLSVVYALHLRDTVQWVSGLVYAGSAIGALFAGDLISLFVYWEITALASLFQIWARRTEAAYRAGLRYLVIQVSSGVLLLAGTILHFADTGSLEFGALGLVSVGTTLIFLAFGIKAAFPLLHGWLEDAYPEATVTGAVFLSAFTTKLAIYALARGFAGTEILVPIGAVMAAFATFYALIENDLRRLLAYSLISQLGFMVVGIGVGSEMALNGTAAHAFASVLYKGLLFMAMGAVLYRTGTTRSSELGGLYGSMPWTALLCLVGSASIAALPLFSGFISKSMILTAAAENHYSLTYTVLLAASAGAVLHSGIRISYDTFFGPDRGIRCDEAPRNMRFAMGGAALLCFALGVAPNLLYELLPYPVNYQPYTFSHVADQLQLIAFSVAAAVLLVRLGLYPKARSARNLDIDWLYRSLLPGLVQFAGRQLARLKSAIESRALMGLQSAVRYVQGHHAPTGVLGDPWSIGATALWAALLLVAYLLMAYL